MSPYEVIKTGACTMTPEDIMIPRRSVAAGASVTAPRNHGFI